MPSKKLTHTDNFYKAEEFQYSIKLWLFDD